MFQLRFLIGSPRRQSPHIFSHRDYRGQRTQQDDFHPQFNTYVCAPKGTPGTPGSKTSYDVMIELMEHSAQNQPASHLFPIIEVWNPETRERLKLAGDEIILRPSDLAAAQEAFNATKPVPYTPSLIDMDVDKILDGLNIISQYKDLPEGGRVVVDGVCGKGIPPEIEKEIEELQKLHPEAIITPGLDKVSILKPIPKDVTVEFKAAPAASSETKNEEPITKNPPLTVLDRVRTEILENGKATATTLSIALNIDAADIKAAVATEGSGLQNKGGWISLIPTEN